LNLADIFEIHPQSSPFFTPYRNFDLSFDKVIGEDGVLRVQLASFRETEPAALTLDLAFVRASPDGLPLTDCESWLEKAHLQIHDAFEASITQRLRDLMQ
jgi:uncharacterized protein (TIGR04255 family)